LTPFARTGQPRRRAPCLEAWVRCGTCSLPSTTDTARWPWLKGRLDCAFGHGEAGTILGGCHTEVLPEEPPHRTDVAEPGPRADVLDRKLGLLEQSSRFVDSDATDERCG